MTTCMCPENPQTIPHDRRVTLYEPTYEVQMGAFVQQDASKMHVFDAACPVHGYTIITDEGIPIVKL